MSYAGICTNGDVRLVGSSRSTSDHVELCANNHWGTVCDDSWDNNYNNAKVLCTMLNYSRSCKKTIYFIYYVIVLYFRWR